jgi:D-aminopeptidase
VRRAFDAKKISTTELANEEMSAIFQAVVEATEESVYNSMIAAKTTTGNGRTIEALPLDKVRAILARYGIQ